MNSPYEDMMDLPRHVSSSHPPMPRSLRAAQFAPFAALTGYSQVIRERSRLTVPKKIPGEDLQEELQRKSGLPGSGPMHGNREDPIRVLMGAWKTSTPGKRSWR